MKKNVQDILAKLVYDFQIQDYRNLNESQTRLSFIDKFWDALGWDVADTGQVLVEKGDSLQHGKRPDYRFLNKNKTAFFVEAKKPAEALTNAKHIYQTKLYCWNGKVPLAILTDFEEFRPFRAIGKPSPGEANKGIIKQFDMLFEEYPDRAKELLDTFGRDAVMQGSLDELIKPTKVELRDTVDKHFLNSLSKWRIELATLIAKKNSFSSSYDLAEATQRILDRLVFLRILQDREIEHSDYIKDITSHKVKDAYASFVEIAKQLAPKYNGLIFNPHPLSEELKIEAGLFKNIVKELDAEDSPYRFDEIPVDVLGTIYERFLGDEINLDAKGKVDIDRKPEVRKAGGVYYTPQYIVEYIVENTVGKLLEDCKTPDDVSKLKILDPACGSGSFLLGAFDALIKWHEDYFAKNPAKAFEKIGKQRYILAYTDDNKDLRLTIRMKGKILQNNIYGVDLDMQATAVAQMSLYIKVLEGANNEPQSALGFKDALLPKMTDNIKCGNSLISTDFISDDFFGMSEKEKHKINPFNWEEEFPDILKKKNEEEEKIWHVTWVTHESRKDNITDNASEILLSNNEREIIAKTIDDYIKDNQYKIIEFNVLQDHVHLIIIATENQLSNIIGKIKGYTSYVLHRTSENKYNRIDYTYKQAASSKSIIKAAHPEVLGMVANYPQPYRFHRDGEAIANNPQPYRFHRDGEAIANNPQPSGLPDGKANSPDREKLQPQYSDGTIKKLWARKYSNTIIKNYEQLENALKYVKNNHKKHNIDSIRYKPKNLLNHKNIFESLSSTSHSSGFDAVIGNPPYIKIQTMMEFNPKSVDYLKTHYISAKSKNIDIYVSFLEKAYRLINSNGFASFILPHKFFQSQMGENIRNYIANKKALNKIVSFGANQIFENATTYTCLFFMSKNKNNTFKYKDFKLGEDYIKDLNKRNFIEINSEVLTKNKWNFGSKAKLDLMDKLDKMDTKLLDITRKIFVGLQTSADKIYVLKRLDFNDNSKDTISVYSNSLKKEITIEKGLLKPFLMGKDVKRYMPLEHNVYVIFPYHIKDGKAELMTQDYIKSNYPMGWQYLLDNKETLENREKGKMIGERFYAYIYPKNLAEFDVEKIITPYLSGKCNFSYDINAFYYHTTKAYSIAFNQKAKCYQFYYLGLFNSKLVWYFIKEISSVFRGGFYVFASDFLNSIPIPSLDLSKKSDKEKHDKMVELVERMLKLHKDLQTASDFDKKHIQQYIAHTDKKIDALVYELYGLTVEEIRVVEG